MKAFILIFTFCSISILSFAQSYDNTILQFRQKYEADFLNDKHSPLKTSDLQYLRYYQPDITYKVPAAFVATPETKPFSMPTHSGKDKMYKEYGILTFRIHDTLLNLHIYMRIGGQEHEDYLFIPFTDQTTYSETFGGGRYLDITTKDIVNNRVELDFNKSYNPYCAYADGYSCPIPPRENDLSVFIRAGEKLFGKNQPE